MKINIIGTGNVGTHLARALRDKATVFHVSSRSLSGICDSADLSILAVSDNAIAEVAERLKGMTGIIAHTSGSTPIDILHPYTAHPAVVYPLQTFSRDKELSYHDLPIFIEAGNAEDLELTISAMRLISRNIREADSLTRRRMHLAAVFACNFANHCVALGQSIMRQEDLDPTLLTPLLEETFNKILHSPDAAQVQTGPAVRHDTLTLSRHMEALNQDKNLQNIYRLLSDSIQKINH